MEFPREAYVEDWAERTREEYDIFLRLRDSDWDEGPTPYNWPLLRYEYIVQCLVDRLIEYFIEFPERCHWRTSRLPLSIVENSPTVAQYYRHELTKTVSIYEDTWFDLRHEHYCVLNWAASVGSTQMVTFLLNRCIPSRGPMQWMCRPLEHAAKHNQVNIFQLYKSRGFQISGFRMAGFSVEYGGPDDEDDEEWTWQEPAEIYYKRYPYNSSFRPRNEWEQMHSIMEEAYRNDSFDVVMLLIQEGEFYPVEASYGYSADNVRNRPALARRQQLVIDAFREGPHPSQVQRRRDERWDRRWPLMQVIVVDGRLKPLKRHIPAPLPPNASIPPIDISTPALYRRHLLGLVFGGKDGISILNTIMSFV